MKMMVDLFKKGMDVLAVQGDFGDIPNVRHNGQHYQLWGFILCEWKPTNGEFLLFHPETEASSGHFDIRYCPQRRDGKYGVEILPYNRDVEIDFFNEVSVKRHWPTGAWNLFCVIDAIENFLKKEVGYDPRLAEYIGKTFKGTPVLEPLP